MENTIITKNTPAWRFQVWVSFAISLGLLLLGVSQLAVSLWIKGFFFMGIIFLTGSCFALAKTIRDDVETGRLVNRIQDAKTQKIIKEYE